VAAINVPVVEVHLSDISKREEFRRVSVIEPACVAQVAGKGKAGYMEALDILLDRRD
jgi:3-dehydroquinate dehydratase-2